MANGLAATAVESLLNLSIFLVDLFAIAVPANERTTAPFGAHCLARSEARRLNSTDNGLGVSLRWQRPLAPRLSDGVQIPGMKPAQKRCPGRDPGQGLGK